MRKITTVLFSLMLSCIAVAQSNPEKYAATISPQDLKKQLSVIASAEMEGRETGTPGQRRAAAYIAGEFQRIGLKPAPGTTNFQQEYPLYYDSITKIDVKVAKKPLAFGKDYSISAQINNSKRIRSNKIVFVGYGITENQYNDYAVK